MATLTVKAQNICTENQVETSIKIQATPEQIWNCLVSFDKYTEWHPYLVKVEGKFRGKSFIKVYYLDSIRGISHFTAQLLEIKPNQILSWGGSLGFIFRANHYFRITPIDSKTTQFVQGEYWKGVFGKRYGRKIYQSTYLKFISMNQKLKERLEK